MKESENVRSNEIRQQILTNLKDKASVKQVVYDNTLKVMGELKLILKELETELNQQLEENDERLMLEFKDNGAFSAQLKIAGDMLIFGMHSNVFQFDRNHGVWKTDYVKANPLASYCGVINIYNFLSDSLKYNRMQDLGYLVGRIFVNRDRHFFTEGKRQFGFFFNNFGKEILDKSVLTKIINLAMGYTLEFDLLVPPYDAVKISSVEQISDRIKFSKMRTGKRLGFQFNADDVSDR